MPEYAYLIALDVRAFRVLHDALSGTWLWPMVALSAVGGGWGALAIVPLAAWSRTRRLAASLGLACGATALAVFGLKLLVQRTRPCNGLEGVRALVFDAPQDFSFPSGHAAGSFAFAVFLALVLVRAPGPSAGALRALTSVQAERRLRWATALALVVFAFGVGLSRIALGVHFPADVLVGALIGTAVAAASAKRHLAGR